MEDPRKELMERLATLNVTPDQLDEYKRRFADVRLLEFDLDDEGTETCLILAHAPSRPQISVWIREGRGEKGDPLRASNNLAQECRLAPDAATLKDLFEKHAGLSMSVADKLLSMAKVGVEVRDTRC